MESEGSPTTLGFLSVWSLGPEAAERDKRKTKGKNPEVDLGHPRHYPTMWPARTIQWGWKQILYSQSRENTIKKPNNCMRLWRKFCVLLSALWLCSPAVDIAPYTSMYVED